MLEYTLPEAQDVKLAVFDLSGRLVRLLDRGYRDAGVHSVTGRGEDDQGRRIASGVYFARFTAGTVNQNQRLVLLK